MGRTVKVVLDFEQRQIILVLTLVAWIPCLSNVFAADLRSAFALITNLQKQMMELQLNKSNAIVSPSPSVLPFGTPSTCSSYGNNPRQMCRLAIYAHWYLPVWYSVDGEQRIPRAAWQFRPRQTYPGYAEIFAEGPRASRSFVPSADATAGASSESGADAAN